MKDDKKIIYDEYNSTKENFTVNNKKIIENIDTYDYIKLLKSQ